MQVPLEISTKLIELSPDLEADLRRRAAKLERRFDRITSCRIAVERESFHHQDGGPFRVRIDITAPGAELVAKKQSEDLNVAIRDAFQAAERQIDELPQRRRVRSVEEPGIEEPESPVSLVGDGKGNSGSGV